METALLNLYASNFVAYYKAHQAHINVVGRNFVSDHKMLGKVYEDLQAEIDVIGELIRTCEMPVPSTLNEITMISDIKDDAYLDDGDGIGYLEGVYDDLEQMIQLHLVLEEETEDIREYNHIANYAQDRVKTLKKYCWQLRSILSER
jgi:DNA-binding ferritin-like protein